MRDFIRRALTKMNKLNPEQMQDLLISAVAEIDRLETVLNSLNQGILVCDTQHTLIMANKNAERYLPGSRLENDAPIWQSIRDDRIREFFEETLSSGDRVMEREFDIDAPGLERLVSISVLPLVQRRQISGSLIYIEDITEKKGKESRLRRAENLASLTTLAAGVAHEIKNPLGSLSIHIQLIQKAMASNKAVYNSHHPDGLDDEDGDPTTYFEKLDKYIAVVNEEIDRLNHIVVDFLFATRPMDMHFREGNINNLIEELVDFVKFEFEQHWITGILKLDKDLPKIDYDERFMKQALLNLVKNAIAAMPEGGELTIRTEYSNEFVYITIKDTGVGISEENLPKIFEPYFTTKNTGSGLGLTLVFKILKEHNGELSVKSKEGEGTTFILTLPIPQRETRLLAYDTLPENRDAI